MQLMLNHQIRHQVFIDTEPEKVYDTITSGDGWNAFFTQSTEIDPRSDGKIVFRWKEYGPNFYTSEAYGKALKAKRPGLFVFEWYPIGEEFPTTIEFDLKKQFGGTVVRLTESGYPDTHEGRDMIIECSAGWGEALTLLKFYLEKGVIYTQPDKNK